MALRPLSLTATTVLAVAAFAAANTQPAPTPAPSPSKRAAKPSGGSSKTPSPEPSKTPGRVFTNEDLPAVPSPAANASPGSAGSGRGTVTVMPKTPGAATLPATSAEDAARAQEESQWRGRARDARERIATTEQSIADLQSRINALRSDMGQANALDPNREQNRQAQITQAMGDLERARAELDRARQALTDLEEEARRKSIPPGWLRE